MPMDPKLQAIVNATPEELQRIADRDLLLSSFRVTAAGVDVTTWGPNGPLSRPEKDREKRHLLAEIAKAERGGEMTPEDAAEFRRLVKRILR